MLNTVLSKVMKMAKYIHKQAAIHALVNEANIHNNPIKRAYTRAAAIIEQITAEDVQPVKRGKWIKERRQCKGTFELYQTYIHCSECGKEHYYGSGDMPKFCDNCGADMRTE